LNNEELREISTEEAKEFADENNILYIETSAVLDTNVVDAFQMLVEKIYEKNQAELEELYQAGKLSPRSQQRVGNKIFGMNNSQVSIL
jgi:hypothetical protein